MEPEPIYRSDYFQATRAPVNNLVRVIRSAQSFPSVAEAEREYAALADCIVRWPGNKLLYDVRLGPGNNDPSFEARVLPHTARLLTASVRWAFLLRSAAGRLQMQRLVRQQGDRLRRSFDDENEALRYLLG